MPESIVHLDHPQLRVEEAADGTITAASGHPAVRQFLGEMIQFLIKVLPVLLPLVVSNDPAPAEK